MPFWLCDKRRRQQTSPMMRFDPRFWTVNFPRPMMAAVVSTGPDCLRAERTFASGDLVEAEAFGLGDSQPVTASAYMRSLTITPPAPVHGEIRMTPDGGVAARWIRRSRIDNGWNDGVDQMMAEETEIYRFRLFADNNPMGEWVLYAPNFILTGDEMSFAGAPPKPVLTAEVVQIGRFAPSKPLRLGPF